MCKNRRCCEGEGCVVVIKDALYERCIIVITGGEYKGVTRVHIYGRG